MNKIIKSLTSLFLAFSFLISSFGVAQAGTDLTVTCYDNGPCDISPASTPLFYETNILPGDEFQQTLTIRNFDINDTCDLVLDVTDASPVEPVNLAAEIFAAISDGSTTYVGSLVLGEPQIGYSYQDLYDAPPISLGSLAPLTTRDYTWYAEFDYNAGNEFQLSQSIFDFDISIECDGGDGGGGDDGGEGNDGGGSFSEPGPASAPKCEDDNKFPEAPGNCSLISQTANTVTLSWLPVDGASAYGIIFTDNTGGSYSALPAYVGNNTSYTISNLFGGRTYTFEIFAVGGNDNLCASPRCSASVVATGGAVVGRPTGQGGEVLGETTDPSPNPESTPEPGPESEGEVLGTAVCSTWKWYIPWILLIAQGFLILAADYYLRKDEKLTKHYIAAGITLASIVIFYLVRECNCYGDAWWFLAWLCKWYWVVSLLLTLILKAINYAFIEETEVKDPSTGSGTNRDDKDEKKA